MIPYRPVAPLALGPRRGWRSVAAAVVMAALLGTTATSAIAAEPESGEVSVSAFSRAADQMRHPRERVSELIFRLDGFRRSVARYFDDPQKIAELEGA